MPNINIAPYSIGARWIHTMAGPPLENFFVNVAGGTIESFTEKPTKSEIFDFGDDCQILPGTVNAHTHLELSQVPGMLDVAMVDGRRPMADWIAELMRFRRSPMYDAKTAVLSAILREEVLAETSALCDIVPPELDLDEMPRFAQPGWGIFRELIAWNEKMLPKEPGTSVPGLTAVWRDNPRTDVRGSFGDIVYGLSPHAPQTVCPELLEAVRKQNVPVAMHLAESPEEIEFLKTGDGSLLDLMRRADPDYDPKAVILGSRPMDYLKFLAELPKVLVIHGNYLDDEELQFLAARRETMAVVYCPRSHDYFGYEKYPLKKMLDLGVRVLLGTDSLASAPDLSVVGEMKYVRQHHPEIPAEPVFRMGTVDGAGFLNLAAQSKHHTGTLHIGGPGRFAFF